MRTANYPAVALCLLAACACAFGSQQPTPQSTPLAAKQTETPGKAKVSGPAKAGPKPKPRTITDLSGFELTDPDKLKQQPMVLGATRGFVGADELPQALAPKLAKVYSTEPTFFWHYTGKTGETTFVLTNVDGTELYRTAVKGPQFRYRGQAPLVPGQTYYWSVEVQPEGEPARASIPVGFVVVGGVERERITASLGPATNSESYEKALSCARIFVDVRAWYDAVDAYSTLIASYPQRAELYEERAMIYAQLAVTFSLAEEDFLRADELEQAAAPRSK